MRALLPILAILLMLQGCAGAVMVGAVGGAMMVNDERSFSTQLEDTNADFQISSALAAHDDLKNQTNITGVAMNGNVLMIGQAPNSMLRDKAINTIQALKLGGKIHNQIRIGNPTSFTTRSNDTWITTKVKSRMLNDNDLDITRIKVITENGEVFLLGIVDREQAELATEIARHTAGVRKVIKVFDTPSS
ncbi:BON domain-containing protein [Shewanella colwelliana]|uniref:BON domain-containing protein n=1 Tax=Shewanella colwelliana TaxID=23 RepID=A0A1E5IUA5_SHECO|nr:BON domain-containing protein [Shewanella colwelliana]MDX1283002.1 BON domain-containing protein [Shewanella colwelliana]OEG74066.1 BON domain-containing protein [Shewanella colwelliana]GIU21997.1 BON domain-containing protein [Shewanella colwelliana]GIU45827.1 BON domain-containing protein [Shewanella colwelliana]